MSFLWGAATSSHQIDGNNIHSDWWEWEQAGNIEGGEISGDACEHWNRFREDLLLAAELGLNSYRFSIEWARLEPEEGKWDTSAFEWYAELLNECEKLGLLPMATLHHFTLPRWVAAHGGFTNDHTPGWFTGYVKRVVKKLGARIPLWCTLNEPNALAIGQYIGNYMPPAEHHPAKMAKASQTLLKCHTQAYDTIHGKMPTRVGRWKNHPLMVGIAHNMLDFAPWQAWNPIELGLARVFHRFYNQTWPDAITGRKQHFGMKGLVPYAAQVPQARGRKTAEFIGINYYTKVYVRWQAFRWSDSIDSEAFPASSSLPVSIIFAKPGDPVSDLGWVIHPKGLGKMIQFLSRYQLPLYITENGIADKCDEKRTDFLRAHVAQVKDNLKRGVDLRGYYHWSLLDNFEWIKGFAPRFGLYEVDYVNQKRRKRISAQAYQELIHSER